jgi:hypothetical protein
MTWWVLALKVLQIGAADSGERSKGAVMIVPAIRHVSACLLIHMCASFENMIDSARTTSSMLVTAFV